MSKVNKLYQIIEYKGEQVRLYDQSKVDIFNFFYSEWEIVFEVMQRYDFSFYLIYGNYNKNIVLSEEDYKFLNLSEEEYSKIPVDYIYPKNITYIKDQKLKDLMFLEDMDNLELIFFIPRVNEENYFWYDLILGFKGKHSLKLLDNFKSNLTNLEKPTSFKNLIVDFNFLQNFFKLETSVFREVSYPTHWIKSIQNWHLVENSPEDIAHKNFYENCRKKRADLTKSGVHPREALKVYMECTNSAEATYVEEQRDKKIYNVTNWALQKKLIYKSLSIQIIEFDRNWNCVYNEEAQEWFLRPEFAAYTNYYELIGGVSVTSRSEKSITLETQLCFAPLNDLMDQNSYNLKVHCYPALKEWKIKLD